MDKIYVQSLAQLRIATNPIKTDFKHKDLISRLDNASDKNTTSIFLPSYKLLWRCFTKLGLSSLRISILIARSATGNSFYLSLELFFSQQFEYFEVAAPAILFLKNLQLLII